MVSKTFSNKFIIVNVVVDQGFVCARDIAKRSLNRFCFKKQLLEAYCGKDIVKNLTNFTGKHLCSSLFVIKLHG